MPTFISNSSVDGYYPMFSAEGKPRAHEDPAYETLVMRVHGGSIELTSKLPYLAIPQPHGFIFLGESSVSTHEDSKQADTAEKGDDESVDSRRPHNYDATGFWVATSRTEIQRVNQRLEQQLRAARSWGIEHTKQIVYATPSALCVSVTDTEWIGGALWFAGTMRLKLTTLGGREQIVPLSKYAC